MFKRYRPFFFIVLFEMFSWRCITGGVVLALEPLGEESEVIHFSYCKINDDKNSYKIKEKQCVLGNEEPYYEIHIQSE